MEVLEGHECVRAALEARRRRIQTVLVAQSSHAVSAAAVVELADRRGVAVKRVPRGEMERLTAGRTHGGIAAVASARRPDALDDAWAVLKGAPLLLVLEGVDDARNLGYTLRSAEALGADAVLVKKHAWEFDGAAVSRASSGAFERMVVARFEDVAELSRGLHRRGIALHGCLAAAKRAVDEVDLRGPAALAIGGEKRGLSAAMRGACDGFVKVPTQEGASLALTHAAAIVLAEAARQRRDRR